MVLALQPATPSDEVLDFLLSAPTPEAVITLHPSPVTQERLRLLLDGSRQGTLNDTERAERDAYLQLEHFVCRLKIRIALPPIGIGV
jgi:hypothetical protein